MKLAVFGANGPTGRLLSAHALADGHEVVAVTRHPESFPIDGEGLTVRAADVYDARAVGRAVEGVDAVLSSLGVPFTRRPIDVYSAGARHILAAMEAHAVKRLVVVSSSAVEPYVHADAGFLLNRVIQPLITATIGRSTYADMRRMEAIVRASQLNWTILRPSGLFDLPRPTAYRLDPERADGAFTARADLAAAMLAQVDDDRFVRAVAAVTTTEQTPTVWQLVRNEALSN